MKIEYDDALKIWGAMRLDYKWNATRQKRPIKFDPANVEVSITVLDEGLPDDDTFYEPPTAYVEILDKRTQKTVQIPRDEFDFVEILREIIAIGS